MTAVQYGVKEYIYQSAMITHIIVAWNIPLISTLLECCHPVLNPFHVVCQIAYWSRSPLNVRLSKMIQTSNRTRLKTKKMTYKSNRILMQKTFHALVTFDLYFYNLHAILIVNIIIVPLLLREKTTALVYLMLFIVEIKQNQK